MAAHRVQPEFIFAALLSCTLTGSQVFANEPATAPLATVSKPSPTASTGQERSADIMGSRMQAQQSVNELSRDIQDLKQTVIALNKNLRVLEEDLLFPANTQLNVYLSLDVGKFFTLESVKLKIDDRVVATHIYSEQERSALARSGIHKLHVGNLSAGDHVLSAFFTGKGPNGRDFKRGTTQQISKENGPKYLELKISDSTAKQQPVFAIKAW